MAMSQKMPIPHGRALQHRARDLVFEHGFASSLLKRSKLQGWILIFGRDSGVAVFHATFVIHLYEIREAMISRRFFAVPKLTLCGTPHGLLSHFIEYRHLSQG